MLKELFDNLLKRPNLLVGIYKRYTKEIESILNLLDGHREVEVKTRFFDFKERYNRPRKFSDMIRDLEKDTRKYKTFYCESPSSSVKGFIKILNKHKLYEVFDIEDPWDIYIPSGYNRVEIELENLKPPKPESIIFGIQGCDEVVSKPGLWKMLEKEYGREKASTIMPQTYLYENEQDIELFKQNYKEGNTYILKKRQQRKLGLLLTKDINEILKAKEKEFTVIQDYKNDVLLVNNRKINLRVYLLLTIKNGILEGHINRYGTCIYNNKDYDPTTIDFESNITSFNLDLDIYKTNPLTFKQLKTYLLEHGYENPDILFDRINENVKLVCDAIKNSLGRGKNLKDNMCIQIFGMDFIIDKNLNPFLLECNKGPDMSPKKDTGYADLINKLEDFYMAENLVEKSYPDGYKSGNGLKVQRDMFKYLGIIDLKSSNNGFYKVY